MADIPNLMQYCPTIDNFWKSVAGSGLAINTSTIGNFRTQILGPDHYDYGITLPTSASRGQYTTNCEDKDDMTFDRVILAAHYDDTWNNSIIDQFPQMVGNDANKTVLIIPAADEGGALPGASMPNYLCTYLKNFRSTSYSSQVYFPIVKLTGEYNTCQLKCLVHYPYTISWNRGYLIFWSRVEKDGQEYLCPRYLFTYDSETSDTSPSIQVINYEDYLI